MKAFSRRTVASVGAALLVAVILGSAPASANPKEGSVAGNARVEDAEGRGLELKTLKGKPFVIVYDNKTSSPTSSAFRRELVKLSRSDPYKSKFAIVIVADVSSYGFWPAKGIVIDRVREESLKHGITIYCDWTGDIRTTYRFANDVSNVVLVGKDGRVAVTIEGAPTGAAQKRLFDTLRAQVEGS